MAWQGILRRTHTNLGKNLNANEHTGHEMKNSSSPFLPVPGGSRRHTGFSRLVPREVPRARARGERCESPPPCPVQREDEDVSSLLSLPGRFSVIPNQRTQLHSAFSKLTCHRWSFAYQSVFGSMSFNDRTRPCPGHWTGIRPATARSLVAPRPATLTFRFEHLPAYLRVSLNGLWKNQS